MASPSLALSFLHFSLLIITLTATATATAASANSGRNKPSVSAVHQKPTTTNNLVRTSCANATYPNVCLTTLSSYSNKTHNPSDLAKAAVTVSLIKTRKTSDFMAQLTSQIKRSEKDPLSDCVEQIGDSIDELNNTLSELQILHTRGAVRGTAFRWRMSNVQTWLSAALTNDYTCLDEFEELDGKVRSDVKMKITDIARVTSNALYLINRL